MARTLRAWVPLFVVLAVVVGAGFYAVNAVRPEVVVRRVERGVAVNEVDGSFEVVPEGGERPITGDVPGRVKSSVLAQNLKVTEGMPLMQLHTDQIDAELEQVEKDLNAVKAQIELPSQNRFALEGLQAALDREKARPAEQQIPLTIDDLQRRIRATEAALKTEKEARDTQISQLETRQKVGELQKAKMTIPAPFDGLITAVLQRVGDSIDPGEPIARAISEKRSVEGKISEDKRSLVAVGQPVTLDFTTYPVDYQAKIARISPTADASKQYTIYLEPEGMDPALLLPGLTGTLTIRAGEKAGAVIVPSLAVVGGKAFVVRDGRAHAVQVQVGFSSVHIKEVVSGLQEGDLVVVDSRVELKDGERVRVRSAQK